VIVDTLSMTVDHDQVVIRDLTTGQMVAMSMDTAAELNRMLTDLLSLSLPRKRHAPDARPADWRRRW
jgi:hypothetical protein